MSRKSTRSYLLPLVLSTVWLVGLAGCGGEEPAAPPAPPPQRPAPTQNPAPPANPPPANPAPADGGQAYPVPALDLASGDAEAGNAHYQQYCASCHGPTGRGDGPVGLALNPKPADHSDGDYMNALDDEHLFKVVKYGGTAVDRSPLMAPWGGTLSDEEIVDVIAFVRSLADAGP